MGVHPTGIALMAPKAVVEPLRLVGVRAPGANIIKQEMLAMGADAANAKGTINCSIERTDVILLGSRTQYRHLAHKLRANQGWFGLDEVIRDIEDYLTDHELATILADGRTLTYEKMRIMGILNVTPDSFYSGSRVTAGSLILKRAGKMLDDGADVLDIGCESTRPGSDPVPAEEEIRRGGEVLLLVDQPYLGHCKVADDWEHGVDAHLREEVAQSVAVICARACEKYPDAHAGGDIGHDHDRPLEPAALQIDLACVTFFLPCGVACDSDQK